MDCFEKKDELYVIYYYGINGQRIFETEIHKKKFLDAWEEWNEQKRRGEALLAYCVLDDQAEILLCSSENSYLEWITEEVWKQYEEKMTESAIGTKGRESCMIQVEQKNKENFEDIIIQIHYLPVKKNYVIWAEDYWWGSYQEYLGRNWMPFQIRRVQNSVYGDEKKSIREIRKKHREWKRNHKEGYL